MLLVRLRNVCLVLASRGLFVGHSMITVWKCATYLNNKYYWMFLFVDAIIIFEAMAVIVRNKKVGTDWLCTSATLYIFATAPAIWLLELDRLTTKATNVRTEDAARRALSTTTPPPSTTANNSISPFVTPDLDSQGGSWTAALEQIFILILILGRWIMPKGNMSRSSLSQLLFVYLAIASDIMGLFVLFAERRVVLETNMHYVILSAWSLSLFLMAVTVSANRKPMQQFIFDPENPDELIPAPMEGQAPGCCSHPEVFSLMCTFMLMDLPFFGIRMYVVFFLDTINYNIIFFIFKNLLMILLTVYRLLIVFHLVKVEKARVEQENENMKSMIFDTLGGGAFGQSQAALGGFGASQAAFGGGGMSQANLGGPIRRPTITSQHGGFN